VSVAVPTADGESRQIEGHLADLSLRGVRLVLNEKLLPGQRITLHLILSTIEIDLIREATVCWTEPRDAESWWVGCSLEDKLEDETIDRMAVAKVLNRRRDTRYSICQPARIRWELSDEVHEVQIVNYSKGGFCIVSSDTEAGTSDRVMLLLESEGQRAKIPARVMWQRPMQEGHAVGCSFTTRDGFVRLRDFVEPGSATCRKSKVTRARHSYSLTGWVAITVFVLLAAEFLQLVGGQPQLWQSVRAAVVQGVVQPVQKGWHLILADPPSDDRSSDPKSSR
jgi:Tfp pilus assembly protein PilZ